MNYTQNKSYYTRSAMQTDRKPSPGSARTHQQNTYQVHRYPGSTSEDTVRLSLKSKQILKTISQKK